MRILTLKTLESLDACSRQRYLFRSKFGDSVEITESLCESVASDFDWSWAAQNLLSAPALAEYNRVRAAAWDEYDRVRAAAWDEYDRVCAAALAEYDRVCAPAWAEYDRVCAPALAEYDRVRAITFGRLYCGEG